MSKFAAAGLAGALIVAASSAAFAQTKTVELAPFSGVDISSGLNADIKVGGTQSVTVEARNPDYLKDLTLEVRDNRLYANINRSLMDLVFGQDKFITIHISVPNLDFVEASSGADVKADGAAGRKVEVRASSGADIDLRNIKATELISEGSSGSDLRLAGTCETATFSVSSGSDLKARDLECRDVAIDASSGSDAEIFASGTLTAKASSGADVEVHGKPGSVKQDASGGGEVSLQ